MYITAYEPFTLVDYPGKLATTVFTLGCALRCPFCHNPEIVLPCKPHERPKDITDEFFDFLKQRQGKLDGVCVTGGEPTLHRDLPKFLERIKNLGFLVKLDTNGVFPHRVKAILDARLADSVAMDIKHAPDKYALAAGLPFPLEHFQESVRIIMESGLPYEFRTTVVPGIHKEEDFEIIGEWLNGAEAYYLQPFRSGKVLDPSILPQASKQPLPLKKIKKQLESRIHHVAIRS